MDDEPMWATDYVAAPTSGFAITIPETANEFAIKALFDRLLKEIRAFSQHENESLSDAWLRMKEMLYNFHGHNLSKGNIIKIFYHGLSEITQEVLNAAASGIFLYKTPNQAYQLLEDKVLLKLDWAKNQKTKSSLKKIIAFADEDSSNPDTDKIMARIYAMTIKMDAQYKELQSRAKEPTPDLDDDDTPISGKSYNPPDNPDDQQNNSENPINFVSDDEDDEPTPQPKTQPTKPQNPPLIEGTLLEEEIFSEFDEFMAMSADENFESESNTEEPPFEKITINTNYKIKTSIEEPPTDLELKPLPDNLEYIQLLDDKKPVVQKQRRLNPNMQEVVKKEIMKLLDTDIIYPIADSPWVSPIHCVPKKGGITVVTNENDELVLTRTIIGWRVCIDYRKLNEATAKDHFPLPFMDQMLERLAGNKYFCFLDGFSGYFQIPIDPNDQEKTTFTCPFRTYAYRRVPFGLGNAPATFQRCMLAIFHDMIEEFVKVKCHFIFKEGIVLGHKVSSAGLEVDKAKINVISKLPPLPISKVLEAFSDMPSSDDSETFLERPLWKSTLKMNHGLQILQTIRINLISSKILEKTVKDNPAIWSRKLDDALWDFRIATQALKDTSEQEKHKVKWDLLLDHSHKLHNVTSRE
ncbi:reverse transcriptase domain-containing protein [Tanacetum coccineum]